MGCLITLVKKWNLVAANVYLKLLDYDNASSYIQKACELISQNEKDQIKVFFLAFKMQC